MDAQSAIERLKEGNGRFVGQSTNSADIGAQRRTELSEGGQHPFAVVVACSDSRVVPEHLFDCGLGELFCIRTAGNTIGDAELASVVYACTHLKCKLAVVLGHTQCGAIDAALEGGADGAVGVLTDRILETIEDVRDPNQASILNANAGADALKSYPELAPLLEKDLVILPALHHIDTGVVEFL